VKKYLNISELFFEAQCKTAAGGRPT